MCVYVSVSVFVPCFIVCLSVILFSFGNLSFDVFGSGL